MSTAGRRSHYEPPWGNASIIGVAGSSGSGKTSLALAIVASLNLPWVVILSMDSFYKPLTPEQSAAAFRNEFDFDAPEAIDFDILVERLKDIKNGKVAEVPIYSFEKHARLDKTTTIYSPHVLILEGIFALHDPRVLELLDLKIFAEADSDLCLSRRLVRDVKERGRDIEGCIKQWFGFVKPNFYKYVAPQREIADLIIPRGIENKVAISMVSDQVRKTLADKSELHQVELKRLGRIAEDNPLSKNAIVLKQTNQVRGVHTLLLDPKTSREDFVFYFDRMVALLVETACDFLPFTPTQVITPQRNAYMGLKLNADVSAVVVLRGGSAFETGLRRTIPDCKTGRILIQTNFRTGEPELHYRALPANIAENGLVLVLDPQFSSGAAALMAVRVLVDHGVSEDKIVFVTYTAGRVGVNRVLSVFPDIKIVVARLGDDQENRWVETKYLGC
ncbi:uridine/cytidine kinase [Parastagonospora nodorum]|uniref:Uridine kinase n=1 Tax=Phaeosphaeria nodorum (strain SN15 / ATCC MYA-4574 / FGSC 10173) TaxID=321614 RepID=A0A7U2F6R1_PHANO|nr:uridine/cytidine kinase [Parastagonospora nodorum]QRC97550.1 uridine/cytidine kinase [Parastagonospora nodorum SN15]KAH3922923.1 uridine/cytidine kinase [Parastagonospora nodorum]KAH3947037.1 uridine/cytidine kinase [Parastagonospora nodorum]KAH3969807.1 uridine/cytidine kinase [Parastagonospora nodorum]